MFHTHTSPSSWTRYSHLPLQQSLFLEHSYFLAMHLFLPATNMSIIIRPPRSSFCKKSLTLSFPRQWVGRAVKNKKLFHQYLALIQEHETEIDLETKKTWSFEQRCVWRERQKFLNLKKRRNANEMRSIYIFARISEGDHFLTKSIFVSTSGDVRTTSEPFLKFPYFCRLIAPRGHFQTLGCGNARPASDWLPRHPPILLL